MTTESSRSNGFGEVFLANRLPLALVGLGVAWLVANNTGLAERVVQDERVQGARRRIGEFADEVGMGGSSQSDYRSGPGGQILGPDGERLSRSGSSGATEGWVHQAAGAARGAISSVRDAGSAVLDRASRYTANAGDASGLAKRASGQLTEKLGRDPWLIGIAGLVAGALVAALLPPTKLEQEYAGEARDELWNKASQLGHDAADRVRELADSTTRAAQR
jgi:hypothetical protein